MVISLHAFLADGVVSFCVQFNIVCREVSARGGSVVVVVEAGSAWLGKPMFYVYVNTIRYALRR